MSSDNRNKMHPKLDPRSFRTCLGQFATGVTIVTCRGQDGQACGTTANSFSSVSLDPPLVLWSIAKSSNSLESYLLATDFAIHVLADDQRDLSNHFAVSDHTLFDQIEFHSSDCGVPLFDDCLAVFECLTHEIHDAGDHHIIVGEVSRFSSRPGLPLLFFGGGYQALQD